VLPLDTTTRVLKIVVLSCLALLLAVRGAGQLRTATRRSPWRDSMTIGPSHRRSGPRGGPGGQPPPAQVRLDDGRAGGRTRSSASPCASSTVGAPACHGPCRPRPRSAGFRRRSGWATPGTWCVTSRAVGDDEDNC